MARTYADVSAASGAMSFMVVVGLLTLGFLLHETGTAENERAGLAAEEHSETLRREAREPIRSGTWTASEIVLAQEECMHLLASTSADIEFLDPIKDGGCGLPAPIYLKSLGTSSRLVFEPPVKVNCRMMAALSQWNKTILQPAAHEILRSSVATIRGGSGYSCRNVYYRIDGALSQHALGNAIDIAEFGLKDGRTLTILKEWGPTARQRAADAKAALKLALSKRVASGVAQDSHLKAASSPPDSKATPASLATIKAPSANKPGAVPPTPTAANRFLVRVHSQACREFETVIGPEANDAHRNHFHFDMRSGRGHTYCE